MIHHLMWIVTAASIVGVILNIHRQRWCFALWSVTNVCWIAYDLWIGANAQAGLQAVYLGLSVWGWHKWAVRAAVPLAEPAEITEDA